MTPVSQGCDCIVLKKSVLREEDRQIGKKKKNDYSCIRVDRDDWNWVTVIRNLEQMWANSPVGRVLY